MRTLHAMLPYLPFVVIALAAFVGAQHVYFYW
jgi:hypothetical protein